MDIKKQDLSKYTWLKIGGMADTIIPSSEDELLNAIQLCANLERDYKILGNGSNVLIPEDLDCVVIIMKNCCRGLKVENEEIIAGASVPLPQLVQFAVSNGYGDLEYLYSVPGSVGGGVYMNAGRGKRHNKTISDHLSSVKVLVDGEIKEINKDQFKFDHRWSSFHENEHIILSANFAFPSQPVEVGKKKIKERNEIITSRERSIPNAGSVFSSGRILPLKGLSWGDAKFVHNNRIANMGNATYDDVVRLIYIAKLLHKLIPFLTTPQVEIEIW